MPSCCERKKVRTENEKKIINQRLNKISGQINGIKKMVDEDAYCDDVLIQLSAIDKAIKSLANVMLDQHMHSCLIKNIQEGNTEIVDEIVDLFKRFQ